MMADTDEKINEYIEKSLNYLSAIGRPIDLKYEQRISIQHLFLGKDVIAILPTGVGKCTIFTVYALTKISWELFCSPWQKNTKQLLNWHPLLHCKPAKSIINNSRSDWFSKANTLVWAEPCARWAELKMLSFWAGGISSFPPCAREYRLLRSLVYRYIIWLVFLSIPGGHGSLNPFPCQGIGEAKNFWLTGWLYFSNEYDVFWHHKINCNRQTSF